MPKIKAAKKPKAVAKSEDPKVAAPSRELAEIWQAMQNLESKHVAEKRKILSMSEISLILDTYDDIFSKFDPRPYSQRGLSEDLLAELKRGCRDKPSGQIELTFLVPSAVKDPQRELLLEKRLASHFEKHYELIKREIWKVKKTGGVMVFVGTFLGTIVAIAGTLLDPTFASTFALVFLEPASWFLMWEGLSKIFEGWQAYKPDLEFYQRMTESKISFLPY